MSDADKVRIERLKNFLGRYDYKMVDCGNALAELHIARGEHSRKFLDKVEELAKARHCYGSDDEIEIDSPTLSIGEDGTWVSAWVFVPKSVTGKVK